MTDFLVWPTAITGTWSDLERRAEWLYKNAEVGSDAFEMAEAVLVLTQPSTAKRDLEDAIRRARVFLKDALDETDMTEDEMHEAPGTFYVRLLAARTSLDDAHDLYVEMLRGG